MWLIAFGTFYLPMAAAVVLNDWNDLRGAHRAGGSSWSEHRRRGLRLKALPGFIDEKVVQFIRIRL